MRPEEEELGAGFIQSPCFVTPFSGFGKADFWVLAKGKSLLFAVKTEKSLQSFPPAGETWMYSPSQSESF